MCLGVDLFGGPSTWPVGNQLRPVGFRVDVRHGGPAGQGSSWRTERPPLLLGGSRWRTGNAYLSSWEPCTSGQGEGCAKRALEASSSATAPFTLLGELSQYHCSWKRALHCCDAVPCMLPLVRITVKPRVPGGLRRRRSLKVPRGSSRPMS